MTALWIGVVAENPRMRMPSMSDGSRPSVSKPTGLGIVFRLRPRDDARRRRHLEVRRPAAAGAGTRTCDVLVVLAALDAVLYGNSKS